MAIVASTNVRGCTVARNGYDHGCLVNALRSVRAQMANAGGTGLRFEDSLIDFPENLAALV